MSERKRRWLPSALAVSTAAALWLLFGTGPNTNPVSEVATTAPVPEDVAPEAPAVPRHVVADALRVEGALRAEPAIRGRVVDPDGNPVAGALVVVRDGSTDYLRRSRRWLSCTSDEAGEFVLEGERPPPNAVLRVTADGFAGGVAEIAPDTDAESVVVLPWGAQVSGRLVLAGSGAPLARATLLLPNEFPHTSDTWSDDVGRYRLTDLPVGETTVIRVSKPPLFNVSVEVRPTQRGENHIDLVVPAGPFVRGVAVRLGDGTVVADASVRVCRSGRSDEVGRTRIDGTFEVQLPSDPEASIGIVGEGGPMLERLVTAQTPSVDALLVFRLPETARIVGRVVDGEGRPVGGADVRLLGGRSNPRPVATGIGDDDKIGRVRGLRTESAADGRFAFDGLDPWSSFDRVLARHAGRFAEVGPITLDQSGAEIDVELGFDRDVGSIRGRVTLGGRSVSGAVVEWSCVGGSGLALADDDGNYDLQRVPAGDVSLRALVVSPRVSASVAMKVTAASVLQHDFHLPFDPTTIAGRVVDDVGAGVPKACVSVKHGGDDPVSTTTAEDGGFSLTLPSRWSQSELSLRVTTEEWSADMDAVQPGSTDLELRSR